MPPYCLNAVGATGGQFPSMNLDFGPLRIAGIVAPDAYALSLPFDAVVLPDTTSLASDAARFSGSIFPAVMRNHHVGPREICVFTDLLPGRHVIKVSSEYRGKGDELQEYEAASNTVSILRVASQMRLSALLFASPFGSGVLKREEVSNLFAAAISTFVRSFEPRALRELVVCVENEDVLHGLFRDLELIRGGFSETDYYEVDMSCDPYATEVRAFLEDRTRPEPDRSSLIAYSSSFFERPLHTFPHYSDAEAYRKSPDDGPLQGYSNCSPKF